jgi:hypothetical protein
MIAFSAPMPAESHVDIDPVEDYSPETESSFRMLWDRLVHTLLFTIYFLLIGCIAIGIDLSLHWFERLQFVEHYRLSRIIQWEIELMAYTLATVDCFLFMRKLIQPVVEFFAGLIKRWRATHVPVSGSSRSRAQGMPRASSSSRFSLEPSEVLLRTHRSAPVRPK